MISTLPAASSASEPNANSRTAEDAAQTFKISVSLRIVAGHANLIVLFLILFLILVIEAIEEVKEDEDDVGKEIEQHFSSMILSAHDSVFSVALADNRASPGIEVPCTAHLRFAANGGLILQHEIG
jgi:hypothetical protein